MSPTNSAPNRQLPWLTPAQRLSAAKAAHKKQPSGVIGTWKCNLTQRDVALAVGLSAAGYHQIETNGRDACLSSCVRLSEFFGKPIPEIWEKLPSPQGDQQ